MITLPFDPKENKSKALVDLMLLGAYVNRYTLGCNGGRSIFVDTILFCLKTG